jgi:hypothetical protein
LEKEVVSILEETRVTIIGFPRKAKNVEVIREIAHMVGGLVEVDEKF